MIAVIAATSAPDGAERDTARLRYQPSHLGGRGRVPWRTTGTLPGAHISRPNATMHWSRSGGWEPGHDFHRGLLTRSSSSAWSPSQTGLGGRFFISAVRNVVSVSIEGRSSRPTCSSHTVGALSRRRKASRTTSRHIGISRQTSSSCPSPLVQRCAVQSTVEPSRRTAVDSLHKPSTHIGTMSSEIHYLLQNPAPSAAAYF